MAVTLVRPVGTVLCSHVLFPHATTVPSDLSARLCPHPAATAVNRVPGVTTGITCPPHPNTLPAGAALTGVSTSGTAWLAIGKANQFPARAAPRASRAAVR